MQPILQTFTIGFFDSSGIFSVYTKKDDVGRALKFHIYDDMRDYTELLSDPHLAITLRVILPSGFNLPDVPVDRSAVDVSTQSVTVPITAEMVQQTGTARCELVFATSLDNVISTTHFKLIVTDSFNRVEPATEPLFDTWTELYIKISEIEDKYEEAEEIRVANENTRIDNENTRIANENARISQENTRQTAETARDTAEQQRDTAEQQRDAAEQVRESRVQEQVDEAHMWADGMTESTDKPSATNNARYYAMSAMAISGLFTGSEAEWNALPLADKANYRAVLLV